METNQKINNNVIRMMIKIVVIIIITKIQTEVTPTTRTIIHRILATEIMIEEDRIIIITETEIERIKIIQRELIKQIILR